MRPASDSPLTSAEQTCYHCGEPVPRAVEMTVEIDGEPRAMCCPGCSAVASLITGSGLQSFYRQRTAYNERPELQELTQPDQYQVYDDPELAATFSNTDAQGLTNASLLLGGISCAACTWLIEQSLSQLPGVTRALVNLQQSRLDIQFDPQQLQLSSIFTTIELLGYHPRPYQSNTARQQSQQEYKADLRRLAVAGLGMMQVGMFAIALHAGDIQGIEARYQALLRWVSLPVATFVVLYSARPFFVSAWRHLKQGVLVMDLPVALAIGLAFLASTWATASGTGQVYFDSVVMFTFLLLLGRFLERRIRQRQAFNWLDAEAALPSAVLTRRGGEWVSVPRIQLVSGDTVLIKAGDMVPVDAEVLTGRSAVKEDTFNGEHLPRAVVTGDTIYAGTVNVQESLEALVLGEYRDSRLAALQRSVDLAKTQKPRLAAIADRVASWFIAGILLATATTALVWLQIAPDKAFWISLSVLVISCPCALALATPAALTSAASALRGRGVIVHGENAVDSLSRCTHLLFDKTGTLTKGALTIAKVHSLSKLEQAEVLSIAAAMQIYSSHPIARAFESTDTATGFSTAHYLVGAGLEAQRHNNTYRLGSEQFCRQLAPEFPAPPDEALYWIGLCTENEPLAWIGLNDCVRDDAGKVIESAKSLGLHIELLTGDSSTQGLLLGDALGIETINRGQTPQQKMAHVLALQSQGAVVAMVGDGLNDAPVLSIADASFAVTGATDLARSQADFVIVDDDLNKVVTSLKTARHCRCIVRQNLCWALGYNLCAIPLAAMGYIPPWMAAIGMSLSSLLVVINSLRLNRQA